MGISLPTKHVSQKAGLIIASVVTALVVSSFLLPKIAGQDNTLSKLSKHIELPNEEPTIVNVVDVEKLKQYPFYENAENGDKVVAYASADKAILYRPSSNKIINFITIGGIDESAVLGATDGTEESNPEPTIDPLITEIPEDDLTDRNEVLSIGIFNGSESKELTKVIEQKLEDIPFKLDVIERSTTTTASSNTTIIDVSGNNEEKAELLSRLYNAKVETNIPSGISTNADIIIVIGSEYKAR